MNNYPKALRVTAWRMAQCAERIIKNHKDERAMWRWCHLQRKLLSHAYDNNQLMDYYRSMITFPRQ